jgi:hypothetical protein
MSKNASQEIANDKPRLLQKIEDNEDLANVLIALLGKIVTDYRYAKGIRFSPISENNGVFTSTIITLDEELLVPPTFFGRNNLGDYMASKNIALAAVLKKNRHVRDFFQSLVEQIEHYATFKRIPFSDLKVVQGSAFISKQNNEFHIKLDKNSLVDFPKYA